ncbi:MAG: chorismate-binding protein [Bdellovibrionia bacterium]
MSFNVENFLHSGCIISNAETGDFWLGIGPSKLSTHPRHEGLNLYAPDFFLKNSTPWQNYETYVQLTAAQLLKDLPDPSRFNSGSDGLQQPFIHWSSLDLTSFQVQFEELKHRLDRGELKKAVPVVSQMGQGMWRSAQGVDPLTLARLLVSLIQASQGFPLSVYGVWNEHEGILGASPEILFDQMSGDELRTYAVAGTRPRSPLQASTSLLEDPKEQHEHRLVIEGIQQSFRLWEKETGSTGGLIRVGKTTEWVFPHLIHLVTPITFTPGLQPEGRSGFSPGVASLHQFEQWVRCLHPTPALGAFPKERGWAWLEQMEQVTPRFRHGAPFGILLHSGVSRCLVAIRNLQWKQNSVRIIAGCGVVPESRFEKEAQELRSKIESVKNLFHLPRGEQG